MVCHNLFSLYSCWKDWLTVLFFSMFFLMYIIDEEKVDDKGSIWIMGYMLVDFMLQPMMESIYVVHHLFALILCSYDMSVKNIVERKLPLNKLTRQVFFGTEWSTIVFSLGRITRSKWIFLLFTGCFLYFRIYAIFDLYWRYMTQFNSHRDIAGLGLYALNCHWLFQILNKCRISMEVQEMLMYTLHVMIMVNECRWTICLWSMLFGFAGMEHLMLLTLFLYMKSPMIALVPYFQLAIYYWFLKKNV